MSLILIFRSSWFTASDLGRDCRGETDSTACFRCCYDNDPGPGGCPECELKDAKLKDENEVCHLLTDTWVLSGVIPVAV